MNIFLNDTIIFEGITGCGKSKQIELITTNNENNVKYRLCDNTSPIYSGTNEARQLLSNIKSPIIPEMLLHQFTNWMKVYEQQFEADVTLIDRFSLSNLVYSIARCEINDIKLDRSRLRSYFFEPMGLDILTNTLTIYFDCPVDIATKRTNSRLGRNYFDMELQTRAHDIYLQEIEQFPYKVEVIDASGEMNKIHKNINSILEDRIRR